MDCSHLKDFTKQSLKPKPQKLVCEECEKSGSDWVHLRQCQICGKVGCCDSSPNKHATAHYMETGHSIMASAEPGDLWAWCYQDKEMKEL